MLFFVSLETLFAFVVLRTKRAHAHPHNAHAIEEDVVDHRVGG